MHRLKLTCKQWIAEQVPALTTLKRAVRQSNEYRQKVGNEALNAVELYSDGIPVPPIKLRDMVRKGGILAEDFLVEGRQACDAILSYLEANSVEIRSGTRVLEFGVGCGRIARHMIPRTHVNFTGSDVDSELIGWCDTNLTGLEALRGTNLKFLTNEYMPPVNLPDNGLDVIYSISVFTHMEVATQDAWMNELWRLLKPEGHLLISILERSTAELQSGVEVKKRIDKEFHRGWLGSRGNPDSYFSAFHTLEYLDQRFGTRFEFISSASNAIRGNQTLVLLKAKKKS